VLDVIVLALSTWLVAVAFVDPTLDVKLTPFGIDPRLWLGWLAVGTFLLTLIQFKTDWKGRSDRHAKTSELYAEVKREANYVLASDVLDDASCKRVFARYDLASAVGVPVPEADFLPQKKRHKTKVAISKFLDTHPSASILATRVRFWFRDTFGEGERANGGPHKSG